MGTRLIRANSDTPNVLNSDDSRAIRFAMSYNGVTKGYGNVCSYNINGSDFKVNSGEIVIDGWQGIIDGAGETITVVNISGTQYYVVYAEIDLSDSSNQKLSIKSTYDTYTYPTITSGDDLTTSPSGVARLELYKFTASSGGITNVTKLFEVIEPGVVKEAAHAKQADVSNYANNSSIVNNIIITQVDGPTSQKIQVTDPYGVYGYIERKKLIFNSSTGVSVNDGYSFEMLEPLSDGEMAELVVTIGGTKQSLRLTVGYINYDTLRGFRIMGFSSGTTWNSGCSFYCGTIAISGKYATCKPGWYQLNFLNDGGTHFVGSGITIYQIYKILGGVYNG